jgi:hypothetical protein
MSERGVSKATVVRNYQENYYGLKVIECDFSGTPGGIAIECLHHSRPQ